MRRILVIVMLAAACGPARPMNGPSMNNSMNGEPQQSRVVSADILARDPVASHTRVKHILIGFRDKADAYGGVENMNPNAAKRTREEAESLVENLMGQIKAGADFDTLMKANSEDPGSVGKPDGYDVSPDANLALEFRELGLRLNVGEVGVTESDFGFHIMKRVE
jgi:hypothetical protein